MKRNLIVCVFAPSNRRSMYTTTKLSNRLSCNGSSLTDIHVHVVKTSNMSMVLVGSQFVVPIHTCPCITHSTPHPLSPHTAVEYSYQGPRLDGDITAEFMQDLLQWFKEEKKLHKKYAYKVSGKSLFSPPSFLSSSLLSFPSFAVEHAFNFLLPPDHSQCEEYI